MKLRFKGIIQKRTGCKPCGGGRVSILTSKTFHLASGRSVTFRVGKVVDLSEADALFLLDETYIDPSGVERKSFEAV